MTRQNKTSKNNPHNLTGFIHITDAATGEHLETRYFNPEDPNSRAKKVSTKKKPAKRVATITAM